MPLPTGDTIGILGDNLRLRGSVLPISTILTRGELAAKVLKYFSMSS